MNSREPGRRSKSVSRSWKSRTEGLLLGLLTKLIRTSNQLDQKVGAKAKRGPDLVAVAIRLVLIKRTRLMSQTAGQVATSPSPASTILKEFFAVLSATVMTTITSRTVASVADTMISSVSWEEMEE